MVVERVEAPAALRIVNTGSAAPETLMLLVFQRGIVVERVELPTIGPGEEHEVKLERGLHGSTVRLVWRYKGRSSTSEYRVR